MKRVLAIILAAILVMALASCGNSSEDKNKKPSDDTTGSNTEDTQQNEQTGDPDETKETEETDTPVKPEITINETVLVDEAGVKITAKALLFDDFLNPEVKLLIENNSGIDLSFRCYNTSVNGYMVETMLYVDILNGKKAYESLNFMDSDLRACGIDAIADIEIAFNISDMVEWETYLDTDPIQIKTSIADTFEYTYDDSGDLAYEGNGIKIVIRGLTKKGSLFGNGVEVYIENSGDKDITVEAMDISVNGFMMNSIFSCDVFAGKRAVDAISFMESDLEYNEITEIKEVEFYFHISDMTEWDTIADTEVLKFTF